MITDLLLWRVLLYPDSDQNHCGLAVNYSLIEISGKNLNDYLIDVELKPRLLLPVGVYKNYRKFNISHSSTATSCTLTLIFCKTQTSAKLLVVDIDMQIVRDIKL